jgi:ATP-dependent DNA helicase RecG
VNLGERPVKEPVAGRTYRQLARIAVDVLEGVGAKRKEKFHELGIDSVLDLLMNYPRRWEDRTRLVPVESLEVGQDAFVLGRVAKVRSRRTRGGRGPVVVECLLQGEAGGVLLCTFFNQAWRERQLRMGLEVGVWGRVQVYMDIRQMVNPVVDLVEKSGNRRTGRIVPIYPASEKVGATSGEIATAVEEALRRSGRFAEPVDAWLLKQAGLVDRSFAMRAIHAPEDLSQVARARRRLAFDELARLQFALVARKRAMERDVVGIPQAVSPGGLVEQFRARLPFALTEAQERVISEILSDMAKGVPMHRLLQGDVGAGKTLVAVVALLAAVESGNQGALMAPTEVLAEQHLDSVRGLLADLWVADAARLGGAAPLQVELLTGKVTGKKREQVLSGLADGSVHIVIGTHALVSEGVEFASLGAVVIDEQHRFGVEQRAALMGIDSLGEDGSLRGAERSGEGGVGVPDLLVMTATPIPRTAAMTAFGDLDVSILDQLPSGRRPIRTIWARDEVSVASAWERVRSEVLAGRRAYVVCPLVEGSERVEARAAKDELERLASGELSGLSLGLLHGQMRSKAKDETMERFRSGAVQVLVATTVIEVGVDVPEATVIVIEDAERFGLAQLHQLRGRVGRSDLESWCYLLGKASTPEGEARLSALEKTTDGFRLAEIDLELRGAGTLTGVRQSGRSDLRLASLVKDGDLLELARAYAERVLEEDPDLLEEAHKLFVSEVALLVGEEEAKFLLKS